MRGLKAKQLRKQAKEAGFWGWKKTYKQLKKEK